MSKYLKAKMPDYGDGPEPCKDCTILRSRIDQLEVLNEELTDLYNKHMHSWAEREKAQDALLDEALFFVNLHQMENGEPNDQVIDLSDRIRNRNNGGK